MPTDAELYGLPSDVIGMSEANGIGEDMQPMAESMTELPAAKAVDYSIQWDKDRRDRLAILISREIERYYDETQPRFDNVKQWREDYGMIPVPSSRWDGASEMCAPFTHIDVDAHVTRLDQQILMLDPPLVASPGDNPAILAKPIIEEFMANKLEEAQWQGPGGLLHTEILKAGNAILRVTYDTEYKRVPYREVETDDDQFETLLAAGMPVPDAQYAALKTTRGGSPRVKLAFKNELVYSGVRLKPIPFEDCVLLPSTVREPEHARGIGERIRISGLELLAGAKAGVYIQEEVDSLLGRHSDMLPTDRLDRLEDQAIDPMDGDTDLGAEDSKYREYECHQLCWRWDANDDGQEELLWVTVHMETRRILRLQYAPYEHGEPHYHWFPYIERCNEPFGATPIEYIAGIQDGATAVWNQEIDQAELATNFSSTLVVDDTAGFDADRFTLRMNTPIRVRDRRGIDTLQVPVLEQAHYALFQQFKDMNDLVAAVSNPSLGRETDTQRTLGEVQIASSYSNTIFERAAVRVALRWAKVWKQWLALEIQYAEGGVITYKKRADSGALIRDEEGREIPAARVNGELTPAPGGVAFVPVPVEVLKANVTLIPAGLDQLSDINSRINQAMAVMNEVKQNPLTVGNAEVQKIALEAFLRSTKFSQSRLMMDAVERGMAAQQAVEAAQLGAALQREQQAQAALQAGVVPPEGAGQPPVSQATQTALPQ